MPQEFKRDDDVLEMIISCKMLFRSCIPPRGKRGPSFCINGIPCPVELVGRCVLLLAEMALLGTQWQHFEKTRQRQLKDCSREKYSSAFEMTICRPCLSRGLKSQSCIRLFWATAVRLDLLNCVLKLFKRCLPHAAVGGYWLEVVMSEALWPPCWTLEGEVRLCVCPGFPCAVGAQHALVALAPHQASQCIPVHLLCSS